MICGTDKSTLLYATAIEMARLQEYDAARKTFDVLLRRYPQVCKAWVSWAQMEKRCYSNSCYERFDKCRQVLQRGLQLNPTSACLTQAWGLMELQRGNVFAAVRLLERCVKLDPKLQPVLKWKHVATARVTLGSKRRDN